MRFADIQYRVAQGIARVTIDRPEKRNALSASTVAEMAQAMRMARDDESVRVVVLTGTGSVFCSGGDLSQMATAPSNGGNGNPAASGVKPRAKTNGGPVDQDAHGLATSYVDLTLAFTELGKPSIAMVNGPALGGGLGLVTACDLAIASNQAQFATPEINVGLWPMIIMATICRNLSRKHALELILSGERISADRAADIGLINRVVPAAELEEATMAWAQALSLKSPASMRLGLRAFYDIQDMPHREAIRYLEQQFFVMLATEDAREGLAAFFEKRPPHWKTAAH